METLGDYIRRQERWRLAKRKKQGQELDEIKKQINRLTNKVKSIAEQRKSIISMKDQFTGQITDIDIKKGTARQRKRGTGEIERKMIEQHKRLFPYHR